MKSFKNEILQKISSKKVGLLLYYTFISNKPKIIFRSIKLILGIKNVDFNDYLDQ